MLMVAALHAELLSSTFQPLSHVTSTDAKITSLGDAINALIHTNLSTTTANCPTALFPKTENACSVIPITSLEQMALVSTRMSSVTKWTNMELVLSAWKLTSIARNS